MAVLADSSTDGQMNLTDREGGEVKPKRPTVGKEKPGITFSGMNHGRDSEPTNRVTMSPESARRKSLFLGMTCMGSIVMRQKGCRLSGYASADRSNRVRMYTEEPYEWNSSSTGLWGGRRVTGAFTRKQTGVPLPLHTCR